MTVIHFSIPLLENEQPDVKNKYRPSLCTHTAQSMKLRKQKLLNDIARGIMELLKCSGERASTALWGGWVARWQHTEKGALHRDGGVRQREPENCSDNGSATKTPRAFSRVTNSEIKV